MTDSAANVKTKITRASNTKRFRKRFIRYSLLAGNLLVVSFAVFIVLRNQNSDAIKRSLGGDIINPLDTLSAADIAVNASRMVNLVESTSVTNQADSVKAELNAPTGDAAVVSLPQILSGQVKTKADIQEYVVQSGDTLGSLATKFGVTSDSIKWSNGLTSTTLSPGKKLLISPVVDGIVYIVKSGDTPDNLASKFSASKDQIVTFNDAEVSGLVLGEKIVIPGGRVAAPAFVASPSFAFGTTAVFGFNGYDYGWCTWYVANRRAAIGRPVPSNLGNAYSWYFIARNAGLPTGFSPAVGAVAVNEGGNHVSVVEQVNGDGSFWVSEMNSRGQVSMNDPTPAGGWNRIDWKLMPGVGNLKFIY